MSISDNLSGEPDEPVEPGNDDWDDDEDVVKVHYDLAAWRLDQRAEATEAFAEAEIPHRWDSDELVVPEASERDADAVFERLEDEIGPFAVLLDDDAESTEYGLDEWPEGDRDVLRRSVTEAQIPHRWEGTTIVVAAEAEGEVDALLDAIESGDLAGPAAGDGPPDNVLGLLFSASDRLAKDPTDVSGQEDVAALAERVDARTPPYGVKATLWTAIVTATAELAELLDGDDPEPSDVIGAAQDLRSDLRPLI